MSESLPTESPPIDDLVVLVRRAREGCAESARIVYERCREPLLVVIRKVIPSPVWLEDSEVLLAKTSKPHDVCPADAWRTKSCLFPFALCFVLDAKVLHSLLETSWLIAASGGSGMASGSISLGVVVSPKNRVRSSDGKPVTPRSKSISWNCASSWTRSRPHSPELGSPSRRC